MFQREKKVKKKKRQIWYIKDVDTGVQGTRIKRKNVTDFTTIRVDHFKNKVYNIKSREFTGKSKMYRS